VTSASDCLSAAGGRIEGSGTGVLRLRHLKPIATGSTRIVYPHPCTSTLLVKLLHPHVRQRHKVAAWRLPRRDRVCKVFLREIREQLILAGHGESHAEFLQRIHGFAETDAGYGMVVEALRDHEGGYARSLQQLVSANRFGSEERAHLNTFAEAILQSKIVISGIHPGNLLYAFDEGRGYRFVLIDGFGERAFIPLTGWSATINRLSKLSNLRSFMAGLERQLGARD
jgi:hypothetical protein